MNTNRVILIVAPPGDLQIGLLALLTSHLDEDILVTGEGSSALKVIEIHKPTIVILDDGLPKDAIPMIIQGVKMRFPETVCVVMVNDEAGRRIMKNRGADLALPKGIPPVKLLSLIKDQLS